MPPRFRHARPLPPRVEPPSADLLDPLSFPQRHNATQKLETALDALANTQDYIEKLQGSYDFCLDTAEETIESYEEKLQEFEEYSTAVFNDLNQLSVDVATKDANNKALEAANKALKTELSLLKKNVARQDKIINQLNQELKDSQKSSKRVDEITVAKAKADISVDAQRRKLLNQDKAKSASKKRGEEEKSQRLEQLKKSLLNHVLLMIHCLIYYCFMIQANKNDGSDRWEASNYGRSVSGVGRPSNSSFLCFAHAQSRRPIILCSSINLQVKLVQTSSGA